jgi:opacity protein-like surface antigen
MRKKSLLAVAVVLLLAVGVAAMSVSSAAAPTATRRHGWGKPSASNAAAATAAAEAATKGAKRLVLIVREVDFQDIDVPPVGQENPGDSTLVTEDAFSPGGRLIGYDQVRFTLMFRQEVFVEATFVLTGRGQIVVEGILGSTEQRPALAVVGGTGEFRNARGQMFVLPGRPAPEETKLVFALLL